MMRLARRSVYRAVTAVALGGGWVAAGSANAAGIVYDLRFLDGSHTRQAQVGQSYDMELWVRLSGTNGNNLDESLESILGTVVSTQSAGGALTSGGITGVSIPSAFQLFSGTTPLHRAGTSNNITADGIVDWGGTSTSMTDTGYMLPRAPGLLTGATTGQAVDLNTWEFHVATLTVAVGSLGSGAGTTAFNSVKPNASGPGIAATYIVAKVDDAIYRIVSNNPTRISETFGGSQGVVFFTPEPAATIGLACAAGVGLLVRRPGTGKRDYA